MKRLLFPVFFAGYCALFLLPGAVFAQRGAEIFILKEVVPFGKEGFVGIFLDHPENPRLMRLQFFTPDNKEATTQIVTLERQGIRPKYEGAFAWKGQLQVLTSLYYPGPKRNHLMLYRYDVPNFESYEGVLVDEAYTPELYRVPFGYAVSPDSSKIMFYSWSYSLPKDPARVTVTVLDASLKLVWQQRYVLPYKNESLYIYNCRLTDDGRAFLLCENYTGKIGPVIDESKIEYFVLGAVEGDENMIIYDINPAGKSLHGLHIDPAPGNAMVGGAFYQDPGKQVHLGLYVFYIPPGGGKMEQGFIPVDKESYQAAYRYPGGDGVFNANRRRFEAYKVRKVELLPEGGLLVAAEQEYFNDIDGIYEFNDVLVMRVHPGLQQLTWMHRLPKRQSEAYNTSIFSAFSCGIFKHNDKWYFLFNDLPENHSTPGGPRAIGKYWGVEGVVIAAELDRSGNIRLFNLTRYLRGKSITKAYISHCWNLGTGELLIFGEGPPNRDENYLIGMDWEEVLRQPSRKLN